MGPVPRLFPHGRAGSIPATLSAVSEGLSQVRERIEQAARRAGRDPGSIRLVAVSKRKPAELIEQAYACGQRDFGENYGQELAEKAHDLAHLPGIRWHHIGQLQSNKVRELLPVCDLLHGVDRPKLVRTIEQRAAEHAAKAQVLLQVNLSREASKSGCAPEQVDELVTALRAAEHIELEGLMTMPPPVDDPEQVRGYFAELRAIAETHGLRELSMGMTGDFEIAIEEGATLVRVGTAIFGARA
jgi:pyridoxal phosphate enzyme (YggS family)